MTKSMHSLNSHPLKCIVYSTLIDWKVVGTLATNEIDSGKDLWALLHKYGV